MIHLRPGGISLWKILRLQRASNSWRVSPNLRSPAGLGTLYGLRLLRCPTRIGERYMRRWRPSPLEKGLSSMPTTAEATQETCTQGKDGFTRRLSDSWEREDLETLAEHLRPRKGETLDLILRQKVYLLQSRRGYRANVDSHMLAFFGSKMFTRSNKGGGELKRPRVLDLGAGNGLVSILFARAHPPSDLCLVELQPQLADRASRNLQLNDIVGIAEQHDLRDGSLPTHLYNKFDVVLINPPFYPSGSRHPPRTREKLLAHLESSASIFDFLRAARRACDCTNPNSFIAVIYDVQELPRLQKAMLENNLQPHLSQEMLHTPHEESTRVIVQMKSVKDKTSISFAETSPIPSLPPLILHNQHSHTTYTHEIESFLHELPIPTLRIGRLREDR